MPSFHGDSVNRDHDDVIVNVHQNERRFGRTLQEHITETFLSKMDQKYSVHSVPVTTTQSSQL